MNQKFKKYFPPLIGILAVFAVWYIVCRAGILSSYVLPSPGRVFQSFCKMLQSGELFRDLRISFLRVGKRLCNCLYPGICLRHAAGDDSGLRRLL